MRPLRIDWPDARHHVFNRTRRCEPIFEQDDACELFIQLLSRLPEKFGVRIHGFALMPDHYHLMLQSDGNLSVAMQWFKSMFVRKLNARRPGWDGSLFRGRFRSKLVQTDRYWRHLLAYVHLNPVASGDVARPEDARWTSYNAYLGDAPDWLTTDELLAMHGGVEGLERYTRDVQAGRRPWLEAHLTFERRQQKIQEAELRRLHDLRAQGATYRSIARHSGRSRSSVHRWLTAISTEAPRSAVPTPATAPTAHWP